MADDTTDATTAADDTTSEDSGQSADETSTSEGADELAGLKTALASERKARVAAEKAVKQHKTAAMSESEKAVEQARAEGAGEAAQAFGKKLARAEFKAAAAEAGVTLGDAEELIDFGRFLNDKHEVDETAVKAAVAKLSKVAGKATPARSGGEMPGSPGSSGKQRAQGLGASVAAAYKHN